MKKEVARDNSFGIVAVILGMLSVLSAPGLFLLFVYGPFLGLALGVLSLVFSLMQRKRSNNNWAKAGLILSIIGIVLSVLLIIWLIGFIIKLIKQIQELQASGVLEQYQQIPNVQ